MITFRADGKRKHLIDELLDKEESFISNLTVIIEVCAPKQGSAALH